MPKQKLFRIVIDARVRGETREDAIADLGDHLIANNRTFQYSNIVLHPSTIEIDEIEEEDL